jgi:uncharacterized membrane protein
LPEGLVLERRDARFLNVKRARPNIRNRLVAAMGERPYLILYTLVSLLLAWLSVAAGRAPFVPVWDLAPWQAWVPLVAMLPACLLAAFAAGAANPLSLGGRRDAGFDPARPGLAGITRHPLLWALALWAASHIVPNGDLAHIILFGAFTAFALVGGIVIDRRSRKRLGAREWRRLAARTSFVPFGALVGGRWRPSGLNLSLPRLAVAIILYAAFLTMHAPIIGVSPLPASMPLA